MPALFFSRLRGLLALSISIFVGTTVLAQQPPQPSPSPPTQQNQPAPSNQEAEVVRISTELVQTDVMVFDREGRFINNLTRDQFELRVDDRPQEISFFEQVAAGTLNEEAQLSAARGGTRPTIGGASARPLDRGRTVFFFVDDFHLAPDSAVRVRRAIQRFIDNEIGQNDQAAIASTSGQIGFLQQLTDNKAVLRHAAARINSRQRSVTTSERPLMSEYQAQAIERNDRDLLNYFITETIRDNPGITPQVAEGMVRGRARSMIQQSISITNITLSTLESLMRSSSSLPGRKIVFFISDGLFLNRNDSDVTNRLRRITDVAARSGVVIYSMDARGLTTGMPDASESGGFDPSGALSRSTLGELPASQEVLRTLAADTGGRALLNNNDLDAGVRRTLRETSVYYLLAWRPETETRRGNRFRRIEVSVRNRPELTVRVRRGFLTEASSEDDRSSRRRNTSTGARTNRAANNTPDGQLFDALRSLYPRTALPVSLSVGHLNAPDGSVLTASMGFDVESLFSRGGEATESNARPNAEVDIAVAVYNDRGAVAATFRQQLAISSTAGANGQPVIYSNQFRVLPGLYQIRVAARNRQNGLAGSATQWIEVPDLRSNSLALSSLFIGERTAQTVVAASSDSATPTPSASPPPPQVILSANRRFARTSGLRFLTYIYNAARSNAGAPDVALQVQVFRDDQPVITAPLRRVSTEGVTDLARIPYAAEISLENLPVGRYLLRVTIIDRATRVSATQQIDFTIV